MLKWQRGTLQRSKQILVVLYGEPRTRIELELRRHVGVCSSPCVSCTLRNELSSKTFEPRSYCVLVGEAIVIREVGFFFLAAAGEYSTEMRLRGQCGLRPRILLCSTRKHEAPSLNDINRFLQHSSYPSILKVN
jgi:hypothetical protein